MIKSANPIKRIPLSLRVSFVLALSFQMSVSQINTPVSLTGRTIPAPPKYELLQALSLGSPAWLSRVLALWLQSQDVQPGKTLSLNELNYDTIRAWLEVQLKLDKNNHYPFMAALHYYGNVRNPQKLRKMLAFVEQNFTEKPETYWRWMAEAVIKAKYQLKDTEFAYELAVTLAAATYDLDVPNWAQQMHIFLLEEMGEVEAAALLLGALLSSGSISKEEEIRFLQNRLRRMQAQIDEKSSH